MLTSATGLTAFAVIENLGDVLFRVGSCDFVDRFVCLEEEGRSTKSHELNTKLVTPKSTFEAKLVCASGILQQTDFAGGRLFRLLSLNELAHAPTFLVSAQLPVELPVAPLKERWELLPELVPVSSPVLLPEPDALVIFPELDVAPFRV
jgi:hypothetical protein